MNIRSLNVTQVVNAINSDTSLPATLLSENGLKLEDFDLFDWNPGSSNYGKSKPKGKDGKIDIMFIVWRNNQYLNSEIQSSCLGCQSGYGLTTASSPTLKGYGPVVTASSYNACFGVDATIPITLSEYFHGLFGHNNWHTAGGADNYTFLDAPRSYSITGQSGSVGKLVNGWDRFTMGWYHPDNTLDTIAALDNGSDPVVSDITITDNPDSMIFILRDFVQTGDVVRIKLPHINWQQNGDVKNQYLWLENRQLQTRFDQWYNNSCSDNNNGTYPIGVGGLYAYIQAGKDIKRGSSIYSPTDAHPNAMGSWLMPLTGEGSYDYTFRTDKEQSAIPYGQPGHPCNWNNDNVPVDVDDKKPNPFTGFSDLFKLIDYNENGILKSGDNIGIYLSEYFPEEDTVIHNAHGFGDWQDAFRLGGNDKLALYTNPASLPVYTYRSNNYDDNYVNVGVPSWENRTIYLNGLSIEILDTIHNATTGGHDIKVKIKWDDYDVLKDVRWTGNIVLQNDTLDPYGRQSQVVLAAGKKIYLDRGLSPIQHLVNDTFNGQPLFTKPTVFTARDSTLIHLKEGSTLYIRDDSRLVVEPDARIIADDSACIVVEDQGVLELRHNNNLTLNGTELL